LIDAGTGVGDLTLEEMRQIDHVFLTHSHLDHIAALPLMLDAVPHGRKQPVQVHALRETIAALQEHLFNDIIWPDFSRIPSSAAPFMRFSALNVGQVVSAAGLHLEVLPAEHTVPAVGYAVKGSSGWWVFSGDTGGSPEFWHRVNQLPVAMLVIETAFSNRESALSERALHLAPHTLAMELKQIRSARRYPIYITHTKPLEAKLIMEEIRQFTPNPSAGTDAPHDIHWLELGQEFQV
jgi:ribonuclease BN (tRNA processing enzyme)